MRDEIIKRTLYLTIISLLLFFSFSLILTSRTTRKNLEDNLISISTVLNKQIEKTSTEQEIVNLVNSYTTDQEYIKIVVANSHGAIIIDSTDDSEDYNASLNQDELSLANNNDVDSKRIYIIDNDMYFVTKINDDIIVRTSVAIKSNTDFILTSIFVMLLLLIVVLFIGILYTRKTSDMIVEAFKNISDNLKTINEGSYQTLEKEHKFPEVNDAIKEINCINESIYEYIVSISLERDKINAIVNNMEQGIIICDEKEDILLINEYAKKALNIGNSNKLIDIFDEGIVKKIINSLNFNVSKTFDYYVEATDKIYALIVSHVYKPWIDNTSKDLLFISIIDVTEARKNDEIKAEFISNASHELKTPITSISGFSELILANYDNLNPDKLKDYINRIYNSAVNMKETIDELLYLSNLENNGAKLDLTETVDLKIAVNDCIDEYYDKAKERGIKLLTDLVDAKTLGSNNLIHHLISNLVGNAIKYNVDNGEVKVSIVDEGNTVKLIVSDTGIGINEKDLDKLFDRFYRTDESRNRKTGGTGLGLTICKKICLAHQTTISVTSSVGVGTEFTIPFEKFN